MNLLIFLVFVFITVESRKLTNFENRQLRNNCGRFVEGYNSIYSQNGDDSEFKVLYGKEVDNGVSPWVVSIVLRRVGYGREFYLSRGTGTIISPYHIVAAAHLIGYKSGASPDCRTGDTTYAEAALQPENFAVFLNVSCSVPYICQKMGRPRDQFIPLKVTKIFIEKDYFGNDCTDKESLNDIAVFEVENQIKFSEFVYPVCLPTKSVTPEVGLENVKLYGYGRDPSDQTVEFGVLRSLKSTVNECNERFDTTDLFCTFATNRGLSCDGDSGAGAVITRPYTKSKEIIGVLSAGLNCGTLLQKHENQKKKHTRLSVAYDLHVDVSKHLPFFCECCGICN